MTAPVLVSGVVCMRRLQNGEINLQNACKERVVEAEVIGVQGRGILARTNAEKDTACVPAVVSEVLRPTHRLGKRQQWNAMCLHLCTECRGGLRVVDGVWEHVKEFVRTGDAIRLSCADGKVCDAGNQRFQIVLKVCADGQAQLAVAGRNTEAASADLQTDHGGKHHTAVSGVILVQKAVQRAHNRGGSLCGIASGFRVGGVTLLSVKMQNHAARRAGKCVLPPEHMTVRISGNRVTAIDRICVYAREQCAAPLCTLAGFLSRLKEEDDVFVGRRCFQKIGKTGDSGGVTVMSAAVKRPTGGGAGKTTVGAVSLT